MDEVFKLYQPHGEPRYGDRHLVIVAEPVYPDDELDEEDTYVVAPANRPTCCGAMTFG